MPQNTLNQYSFQAPPASRGTSSAPASFGTVGRSMYGVSANQQAANALSPTFGPRDTQPFANAYTAARNPQTPNAPQTPQSSPAPASTQPALPDWMNPQTMAIFQSLFQGGGQSALPGGVNRAAYTQDINRAGGLSALQRQQQSFPGMPVNPYAGTDVTRLANDPFSGTSAARDLFR